MRSKAKHRAQPTQIVNGTGAQAAPLTILYINTSIRYKWPLPHVL